jgi:glutamate 5-kinase
MIHMLSAAKAAKVSVSCLSTAQKNAALEAIPILNENDTVATDEIVIGDNDTLAAIVAESIDADLLVLLSDIDGLYTADPHKDPNAKLLSHVSQMTDEIRALGGGSAGSQGTGGMVTKLQAARICMECGCDMVIANGSNPANLYDIVDGKQIGTTFTEKSL